MRALSKSKLMAYRQCPKRLWLEIHRPELSQYSATTQASFDAGHRVGDIARNLYDPDEKGALIDLKTEGIQAAIDRSAKLLKLSKPVFEAGFSAGGALAFADVMLPIKNRKGRTWKMIEVKSSGSVKDYHRDDTAVQAFVARSAGISLESISLAHIDTEWVYPGNGDYDGLLTEVDLTEQSFAREEEVKVWISDAQKIARKRAEPKIATGRHCQDPFDCGFVEYCQNQEPHAEFPVSWLPGVRAKSLREKIASESIIDLRYIPDDLLTDRQLRVKSHTLVGKAYFDARGAAADLAPHKAPFYFLDFETITFAVPIWKRTRPFQQIPFQFSVHRLSRTSKLKHHSFLDLSGEDPSRKLAEALIDACGKSGAVFAYNAGFEKARISELARRFPRMKKQLLGINDRIVDLLRVAQDRYYHPGQQGSWSIKKVMPCIAPDLNYEDLDGVQNGGMAMEAFIKATSPETPPAEKEQIRRQLLDYCALDTLALIRIWKFFTRHKS